MKHMLKKSPIYSAIIQTMLGYEYAYLGGHQFKMATRKKRPSEDEKLHQDLIQHTVAQPICRYVVESINDVVFEPGIKRDIRFVTPTGQPIDPEATEWADLFLRDADLTNLPLNGFMEHVGTLTSIFGHCWVFVDMPSIEQGSSGRPYVCAISPTKVWDWEFEMYNGRPMLEYVKILESEEADCYYFKIYKLGDSTKPSSWESWEVEKTEAAQATLLASGEFPPGMAIPGFIAYGRRDPRTIDVGVSDIDAASDAMREHYKLECEAYQSIQFAKTIIRADAGIKVPAHAGAIVRANQGQIEAISIDTGDVDKIITKQQDILEQLESLTGLGGLRTTRNQPQSGVSIIEERRQIHRLAKSKARLMEVAEEQIWTFVARFMNVRWAGQVNYDTNYESSDTNYRLALMRQARDLVPGNPIIDGMIANEMIALLAPVDDVPEYQRAALPFTDPSYQLLNQEQEQSIQSTDMASQLPEAEEEEESEDSEIDETQPGIIYTGRSSYNPAADMLVGQASGR